MKIHILGIAGTLTAPLGVALKNQGHLVSGSDQKQIYPPISNLITDSKLLFNPDISTLNPDLVIVGPSFLKFEKTKMEYQHFLKTKTPLISATKYIAENVVKKNSILVAGAYGKSTITALISTVLTHAQFNPSYMFGAIPADNQTSLCITNSDWSVVEADESINGLDDKAKFLHYPVKYLVLTSALWEHKDSYNSSQKNFQAFKKLVKSLPKDGLLIYNELDSSAKDLAKFSPCPNFSYSLYPETKKLFGFAFQNNLAAAATLCLHLGIDSKTITHALNSFSGLKRRLELVFSKNDLLVFDDFAQSAQRISQSLTAIKARFPSHLIISIFEAQASFLLYRKSLLGFDKAFEKSDKVLLAKLRFSKTIDKSDRITATDYQHQIGDKLIYLPLLTDLYHYLNSSLQVPVVVVRFSTGSLSSNQAFYNFINSLSS